ncbi:PKD domain-containing protein [Cyclobacterium qasimii]|uniref:Cell surface protein n=2 Tax=Cyclobacterium qasimii TaxID=1350429 RepID=S7VLX0_9BACT|nr:PKD domain-containing protein [Cyclobacterium qasimii]EPR70946.1 cell surface protein [Cyclobacterium qasimii M12-11B]GEO19895.1 hypothetical protein CQA01_04290 [Cyclobacterium qasimii]
MKLKTKFGVIIIFLAFFGCKEETPEPILVKAIFSPEVSTIKEKEQVTFTDQSTNNPTSRNWSFEGGVPSSSTEKSPTVTFESPGQYQVTLTVTGPDNSDNATGTVTVEELVQVVPIFDADTMLIKVGGSIVFEDLSEGNPNTWSWVFEGGDPSSSSEQHPTVTYAEEGSYAVSLTVSNEDTDASETIEDFITVEVEVASGFGDDADGWTIVGDASGGSNIDAAYSPFAGLDDSGYIYAEDKVTGGVWYFNAPNKYLGDKVGFYGGALTFWLIQDSNMRNQFNSKDVIIRGNGKEMVYYHDVYPSKSWTSFTVPIDVVGGWVDTAGEALTKEEMEEILAEVTSIWIRGEFETGADTGGLDQFEMIKP